MASQVRSILRALFDDDDLPTPGCAPCQEQLAALVEAELAGQPAGAAFPTVDAHLGQCAACQRAYQELKALLALQRPPSPPETPHPMTS